MNKLNLVLILIAVALIVIGRRSTAQRENKDLAGSTGNLQLRERTVAASSTNAAQRDLQNAADARPKGKIDGGMVVPSPYNGDPNMAVRVPFNGDQGMIRRPNEKSE